MMELANDLGLPFVVSVGAALVVGCVAIYLTRLFRAREDRYVELVMATARLREATSRLREAVKR